jgi:5-methylcytosine-specific restriction endonuclease McrA
MELLLSCPHCKAPLRLPDDLQAEAGDVVVCPDCGKDIIVPGWQSGNTQARRSSADIYQVPIDRKEESRPGPSPSELPVSLGAEKRKPLPQDFKLTDKTVARWDRLASKSENVVVPIAFVLSAVILWRLGWGIAGSCLAGLFLIGPVAVLLYIIWSIALIFVPIRRRIKAYKRAVEVYANQCAERERSKARQEVDRQARERAAEREARKLVAEREAPERAADRQARERTPEQMRLLEEADALAKSGSDAEVVVNIRNYKSRTLYRRYLKTEHWKAKKAEALARAGHKCQLCGKPLAPLNVHHNTYTNLGDEKPEDLVVICRKCHKRHHRIIGRHSKK